MKKNILILAHYFPPHNHVASNRILALSKYLDIDKCKITLLLKKYPLRDVEALQADLDVKIIEVNECKKILSLEFTGNENRITHLVKSASNRILHYLPINLDEQNNKAFLEASFNLIKTEKIDTIITSCAPVGLVQVGLKIKEKLPYIEWISDMRDELSTNPSLSIFRKNFLKKIEIRMLNVANLVTSVSLPILDDYKSKCKNPNTQFLEIRNGYDFSPITANLQDSNDPIFKIAYTGTFYNDIKPDYFYQALEKFLILNTCKKIELHIFGGNNGLIIPPRLKDIIKLHKRIEYSSIPETIAKMDCLIIIHPTNKRKGVFTTKIFDYIAVNVPILAMINPSDVAANLILESNSGFVSDHKDTENIAKTLGTIYSLKINHKSLNRNWSIIEQNHRKVQIQKLNNYLFPPTGRTSATHL